MPTIALNKGSLLARGAVGSSPADDAKPASGAEVANDQAASSGGVAAKRDAGATTEPSERTTRVATAGNNKTNSKKKLDLLHSVLANTDKHSPKLHPSRWIPGGTEIMMPRVNKSAPNMNYCEVPVEREVGCIRKVGDAAKAVSNSEEHVIELALDPDFEEEEQPAPVAHRPPAGVDRARIGGEAMVVDLVNLPDTDLSAGGQEGTGFGIGNQKPSAHQMLLQGSESFKELFGGGNGRSATSSSDYTNETDRLSRLPISPIDFMSKSSCSLHSAKTFTTTQYGGSSFAADRSVVREIHSHSQIKRNPGKIMGVLLQPHVYCRIRPQLSREERLNLCVDVRSETAAEMLLNGSGDCHKLISILDESTHEVREFKFHNVFQQQSTQEEIFHNIGEPCFQSWAYNRISTCLFAHGQTSLLPRILWRFFESFPALSVSVVEIYREQIYDLLNKRQPVKCYNSSTQTIKRSVTKVPCDCYKAALKAVEKGNRLRVEARTVLNSVSSRGHLIILLEYRGETLCVVDLAGKETEAGISSLREVLEETARRRSLRGIRDNASASDLGQQHQQHQLSRSESNDLALAGVESRSRSSCGPTSAADSKIRMLELKFINKSLFHLSEVIQNLRKDSKVVCYRNSKLTYLLQDWLSSKQVYLLATISPSELCFEESLATLRFADAVANLPKLRETPTRDERGPTWSGAGAAGGSGWEEADLGGVGGPSVSPEDRCPITLAPRLTPASRRKEGAESSFFGLREEAGSQGAENCPFWSSSKKTIERVGQNALLLPS
eukprot:g1937.t1